MSRAAGLPTLWARANDRKHPCSICGEPVKVSAPYFYRDKYIPRYCSYRCSAIGQHPPVFATCVTCGKQVQHPPSRKRVTCGRECYRVLQRQRMAQHGNPNWRGGIQGLRMMIRNSPLYDHFRVAVLTRAAYACEDCGLQAAKRRRTNSLDVHHITSVESLLDRIFAPDNGLALCPDCHTARHLSQ